jgi:hypothetical protein
MSSAGEMRSHCWAPMASNRTFPSSATINIAGCCPREIRRLVTSYASKIDPSVSANNGKGYFSFVVNRLTPSTLSGAIATSEAPVASMAENSSRNCARCFRQKGHEKPRKKTRTTGPSAMASSSFQREPSASGRSIGGAAEFTAAVLDDRVDIAASYRECRQAACHTLVRKMQA